MADAIGKVPGVVDVENGIDNTISGPATNFQVDPIVASRLGFTPAEVSDDATSILDGITTNPLIANGRAYTIRVRLGDEHRGSLDAIEDTVFNSASGHTATLGSLADVQQLPPQNEIQRENLQQLVEVTADLEGSNLGGVMQKVQQAVADLHLPASVRVEYGGTYQQQQQSFHDLLQVLVLALALVFGVLLAEFRNFPAPIAILASSVLSISGVILALLVTGIDVQRGLVHGTHHGHRHRGQERHPAARCRRAVPRRGRLGPRSHASRGAAPPAAHRDDRSRRRLRHVAIGLRPRRRLQMLQPLAIAVIGGLAISMVLSLVVTPLVYFLLTRNREVRREEHA